MTARMVALLMVLGAAILHLAVARPLTDRAFTHADAFGAARVARQELTVRHAEMQRRSLARARAMAAVQGASADPDLTTRAVRQSVARAVEGTKASGVQLAIRPSEAGIDVSVVARGNAADVLDLTGKLARPEFGVVLERVALARSDGGKVTVQVKGLGVAATR
jgi:hypothetical protein